MTFLYKYSKTTTKANILKSTFKLYWSIPWLILFSSRQLIISYHFDGTKEHYNITGLYQIYNRFHKLWIAIKCTCRAKNAALRKIPGIDQTAISITTLNTLFVSITRLWMTHMNRWWRHRLSICLRLDLLRI